MKKFKVFYDIRFRDYSRIPQSHIDHNRVRLEGLVEVFEGTAEEVDLYFERTNYCAVTVIPKDPDFCPVKKVTGFVKNKVAWIRIHLTNGSSIVSPICDHTILKLKGVDFSA